MTIITEPPRYDCILVGGGLQSGLLALALQHYKPHCRILMIERGPRLGGNHTWSFHPGDVPKPCRAWIEPLIEHVWDRYEVRLGKSRRQVSLPYASISSEHFARVIEGLFSSEACVARKPMQRIVQMATAVCDSSGSDSVVQVAETANTSTGVGSLHELLTNTNVESIFEDVIHTSCGKAFRSDLIVDCRGPERTRIFSGCGYQKFHGFEIELTQDWPHELPVIMESVEDQSDGFRFLYTLPFSPRRILVEDTRFSDSPDCARQECLQTVQRYLHERGIRQFEIVREESGVLPMPFTSELLPRGDTPLTGGYAGGWFHSATGYSFPMAVAFAEAIALGPLSSAPERIEKLAQQHRWRARYARFLNRLLFRLVEREKRYRIFSRFYRVLSDASIERFYSHRFDVRDALRIVVGLPPTIAGLRPIRFLCSFFKGAGQ